MRRQGTTVGAVQICSSEGVLARRVKGGRLWRLTSALKSERVIVCICCRFPSFLLRQTSPRAISSNNKKSAPLWMRGGKVPRSFTDQRFRRDKEVLLQVETRELSFSTCCSAERARRMVGTAADTTLGATDVTVGQTSLIWKILLNELLRVVLLLLRIQFKK